VKIRPSILRKAHHRAIESQKRVGEWVEEAIRGEDGKRGKRRNTGENRETCWGRSF